MAREARRPRPAATERSIGRRVAVGFGAVAVVAIATSGVLLALLAQVAGLVGEMRQDEAAIRASLALAAAVREQYIHQAHYLLSRDAEHLRHYERWREDVQAAASRLDPLIPAELRPRLARVAGDCEALDRLFRERMLPAVRTGDRAALLEAHERAEELSSAAATRADAIARTAESAMAAVHRRAIGRTRLALVTGAGGILLVLVLSGAFTLRLRAAVLRPLDALGNAARRLGAGDFATRVGAIGEGEIRAVAAAFDHMAGELQRRERRLVDSERMAAIGQLAAGVAHEINNPIGIIRGYLKTIDLDGPREDLAEELRIIDDEAATCQRIADDLVAYARSPELRLGSVAMEELLEGAVRRLGESGVSPAQVHLDAGPGVVRADRTRLRQVVLNLLRNAAEASPPGGVIDVTGRPLPGGGYEFAVADRGPGIPEEERARVFEPFFSRRAGGTGLGLAVCRGIVRAHGGTIAAEPREGGGTTMRVRIPGSAAGEAAS